MHELPDPTRRARSELCWLAASSSLLLCLAGCDTAAMRVPGLSLSFPETVPFAPAASTTQDAVFLETPRDVRAQHIGEDVAKTGWTACTTDTMGPGELVPLLQKRISAALVQTKIFGSVTPSSTGARWILSSDIRAFC